MSSPGRAGGRRCAGLLGWLLLLLLAGPAGAAPDWSAIEGDLRWPTNYYTHRDALLARFPREQALSVRDFGAKGDGVADDTRAVQKALNAAFARQRALFFPAGTYLLGTLADLQPHAFLSIGYEGKPGSLVLLGDGQARLWSTRHPPLGEVRYPTSPLLRIFAGATNVLVQGLAFDRSGTPPFVDAQGQAIGNDDHAGGLQLLPGRGQRGFDYVGLVDCEFLNCRHAFSLYPQALSLARNPWMSFPTNGFNLVHLARNRFLYTNEMGGTATWFDGVRLLVAEENLLDGQLDNEFHHDPTLKNHRANIPCEGWLYGQCEQAWVRSNRVRNASFELLGYTFGYRLFERERAYAPGEFVVFERDLWERQTGGPKTGLVPGSAPGWRRTATNFTARFVHRFLANTVEGRPVPGVVRAGAYVGLRTDLASLVAVSNRFENLLEGVLQSGLPNGLPSGLGYGSAGSVIRGNQFLDCTHGLVLNCGPGLVAENDFRLRDDAPAPINGELWHPLFIRVMDAGSGTCVRSNVLSLGRAETSAPPALRQWKPLPNAASLFVAGNGVHACAEGNWITNFACGAVQSPWTGSWTLRGNVWSGVAVPWEGMVGNFIADETLPLPPPAPGWYAVASLDRAEPGRGALEISATVNGTPVRYRFEVELAGRAEGSRLRVTTDDPSGPGEALLAAVFCREDGALLLRFGRVQPVPATVRFTTATVDGSAPGCAVRPASGIRWRWPGQPADDVPPGLLESGPRRGLLRLSPGVAELPLFR